MLIAQVTNTFFSRVDVLTEYFFSLLCKEAGARDQKGVESPKDGWTENERMSLL